MNIRGRQCRQMQSGDRCQLVAKHPGEHVHVSSTRVDKQVMHYSRLDWNDAETDGWA